MISPSRIAHWPPLLRAIAFIAGVIVGWLPFALPFYWLSAQGKLPGGDLAPTALLYLFFLGLLPRWERKIHHIQHPWHYIGLTDRVSVLVPLVRGGLHWPGQRWHFSRAAGDVWLGRGQPCQSKIGLVWF